MDKSISTIMGIAHIDVDQIKWEGKIMAFRFDMQGKTPRQQIIVAKRDAEDARSKSKPMKNCEEKRYQEMPLLMFHYLLLIGIFVQLKARLLQGNNAKTVRTLRSL